MTKSLSKAKLNLNTTQLNTLDELEETYNSNTNSNESKLNKEHLIFNETNKKFPGDKRNSIAKSSPTNLNTSRSISSLSTTSRLKHRPPKRPLSRKKSDIQSRSDSVISMADTSDEIEVGVDYDKLVPSQSGDLTKINYINGYEKYLITRVYSNVSHLTSFLYGKSQSEIKIFLSKPDENECLPLFYAIKASCLTTVKYLINLGASLMQTTSSGDPAPHLACLLGVSVEIISYLIEFDSKKFLTLYDQEGWSILHCACNQGHLEIVKYLIGEYFVNPNLKDKYGHTGLQLAVVNNHLNIVNYFLTFDTVSSVKIVTDHKNPYSNNDNPISSNFSGILSSVAFKPIDNNLIDTNSRRSNSALGSIGLRFDEKSIKPVKSSNENNQSYQSKIDSIENSKNFLTPIVFYSKLKKNISEQTRVYGKKLIDLNNKNNLGQNVLHLACRYGKYDCVNILLKNYGSNTLNLNETDFKGRTCLDLAWFWLLGLNSTKPNLVKKDINETRNMKIFYDVNNAFYIQENNLLTNNKIDSEIKLIHLLKSYGAKFSNHKLLLFDFKSLSGLCSQPIDLPSDYFHPQDHITFYNLKLQSESLVSILTYLKSILFVLKLNIVTMFLNSNNKNFNDVKTDLVDNFESLVNFIKNEVVDSFEKNVYFDYIDLAKKFLSNL